MKYNIIFLAVISLLLGCGKQSKTVELQSTLYGSQIINLVNSAIGGNAKANDSLSTLFDMKSPIKTAYNQVYADSILNYQGKRIYYVMLEHPVPIYNRFAIYDEKLKCYLIDKSLNGNLKSSVFRSDGEVLIQVDESFISKDDLEVIRRSMYLIKGDTASLAFRNFMQLKKGESNFVQDVVSINKDSIVTTINTGGEQEKDVFIFDHKALKYISDNEKFQKLVFNEISSYSKTPTKPQIMDEKTALEAMGVTVHEDTINTTNNYKNKEEGFSVFIPDDWKVFTNFTIPGQLKKHSKGTYFMNNSRGAKFYVIKIAEGDSAETYINMPFTNMVKGKYFVRYTEKTEVGNNLYLYFEIGCTTKKFLFYFEVPKFTYEENKASFESIINSFEIDC